MPVILAFFVFLVSGMLLSAVLTPGLYPLFEATLGATPDRSLYRFAMVLGLFGMPFLLAALSLRGKNTLGFGRPAGTWPSWLKVIGGVFWGAVILTCLVTGLWLSDNLILDARLELTSELILRTALAGLVSGLLVGLIEEFFFRGPMHSGARRSLPFWPTALLTGWFYSAVHFIRPPAPPGEVFDIPTALQMTFDGLSNIGGESDPDRFVALLVAGVFLSMVRERTGSIFWAIGIHAGWVMVIKVAKRLTETNPDSYFAFLLSSDGITGWLSAAWMALIAAIYWWWSTPKLQQQGGIYPRHLD